ncbi:hypothetical protein [Bifidobacterium samirii]|uniref:hypothetical protein n=1 Tax=Bifidobacterium samirii TaxID=2306974 RepID=UPI0013DF9A5D|nr:hypothetical protein [Bifidobacterium samirii]
MAPKKGESTIFATLQADFLLAERADERLIRQGIDGLCDADDADKDVAPAVVVEAAGKIWL